MVGIQPCFLFEIGPLEISMFRFAAYSLIALGSVSALGQAASSAPADLHTSAQIHEQGEKLLAEAQKATGKDKSVKLDTYAGHFTMLATRAGSGGAELHERYSDFFIAQDGEATVLVGGTIVDRKDTGNGEIRGTRVEGGTPYVLHKGDVLHIAPNVPHQTTVAPGKTFVYFVIKVEEPK